MKILKYLLLLIFLFLIGLTVFIATQKGDYTIVRSKIIKIPRSTVFNYVNDYKNWETFASWSNDGGRTKFIFPNLTKGKGASCSWNGISSGKAITTEVRDNTFIHQKFIFNDTETLGKWTFKDTLGKTKVTWETRGKMDVFTKIKAYLNGGIENIIGDVYEKSLYQLDRTLDYEINTFKINSNGIVARPKMFYIGQTITSNPEKVNKNIRILIPKMVSFFKKNNMVMLGKPFVIMNAADEKSKVITLSVCIPVKDSIAIMEGSELMSGTLEAHSSVKTTLMGDYSHFAKADQKALNYIFENQLKRNFAIQPSRIYLITYDEDKHPSKWTTELYYPVYPKVISPKSSSTPKPKP
jgi:hypothetical protein